jgi:hypothetical protein
MATVALEQWFSYCVPQTTSSMWELVRLVVLDLYSTPSEPEMLGFVLPAGSNWRNMGWKSGFHLWLDIRISW